MNQELNKKMIDWISGKDTGASSVTLWTVIMNVENYSTSIPYDVDDFRRCYELLKICDKDTKYTTLEKVKRYSRWIPIVESWDKLEELYLKKDFKEFYKLLSKVIWP